MFILYFRPFSHKLETDNGRSICNTAKMQIKKITSILYRLAHKRCTQQFIEIYGWRFFFGVNSPNGEPSILHSHCVQLLLFVRPVCVRALVEGD